MQLSARMDEAVEAALATTDPASHLTQALVTLGCYRRPGARAHPRPIRGVPTRAGAMRTRPICDDPARLRLNVAGAWWAAPTSDDEHEHGVLRQSAPVLGACAYGGGAAATPLVEAR